MFEKYFGFLKTPFTKEIKASDLFPSAQMKELVARLSHLLGHRGVGLITGEIGSGKSTLLRAFAEKLEKNRYHILYLSDPTIGSRGMLREISTQLAMEPAHFKYDLIAKVKNAVTKAFNDYNKITLLIIDEAQLLTIKMLEELRLLTNFHMDSACPLTLVLLGQPDLRKRIQLQSLEALNQRITLRYHLVGLSRDETRAYILHQLEVAGRTDHLFSDDASEMIFLHSKGLPRLINNLSTSCLLSVCLDNKNIVDQATVEKVLNDADML
jgi:type II secretory pathway predicted ATPase ExeA